MSGYTPNRVIGRGGFGIVEEVQNARGELFARKTFSPASHIPVNIHDKLRKRFKREVTIQSELGGKEIMPVIDSNLDCDTPWFIMPLAEATYENQIATDKSTGSVDIDAVADILNGLQHLHDLGYVHRDLNPKNILKHNGNWKLSDLGAVLPPTGQTVTLTEGTTIYTELYCSPEQRIDFHRAQAAADVYSFGCILHDIFGTPPRTPYAKHTATGPIGVIVEKCTEQNPVRRPSISVLRSMLLDALVEIGGHCKIDDKQSEEWLLKIENIQSWTDDEFGDFARFFASLDLLERSKEHGDSWVYSLSTPFLTRIPADAFGKIAERQDGLAAAIIEKYCEWVGSTAFLFHFSDSICSRLTAIFDKGTPADKAIAFAALVRLGETHNRWYVMRCMLRRCGSDELSKDMARRLAIEIKTEEIEEQFKRCVREVSWNVDSLAPDIAKLC